MQRYTIDLTPRQRRQAEKLEAKGDRHVQRGNVLKALRYYTRAQVRGKIIAVTQSLVGDLHQMNGFPRLQQEIARDVIAALKSVAAKNELELLGIKSWDSFQSEIALEAFNACDDDVALRQRSMVLLSEDNVPLGLKGLQMYKRVQRKKQCDNIPGDDALCGIIQDACIRAMTRLQPKPENKDEGESKIGKDDKDEEIRGVLGLLEISDNFEGLMKAGTQLEQWKTGLWHIDAYSSALHIANRKKITISEPILMRLGKMFSDYGRKEMSYMAFEMCGALDEMEKQIATLLAGNNLEKAFELLPRLLQNDPRMLQRVRPLLEQTMRTLAMEAHEARGKKRKFKAMQNMKMIELLGKLYP